MSSHSLGHSQNPSRFQQIIDHERSIARSLAPFGLTVAFTAALVVIALWS